MPWTRVYKYVVFIQIRQIMDFHLQLVIFNIFCIKSQDESSLITSFRHVWPKCTTPELAFISTSVSTTDQCTCLKPSTCTRNWKLWLATKSWLPVVHCRTTTAWGKFARSGCRRFYHRAQSKSFIPSKRPLILKTSWLPEIWFSNCSIWGYLIIF